VRCKTRGSCEVSSAWLVAAIALLALFVVYLQFQVNGLQEIKRVSVPVDDVSTIFDGGPFVPVGTLLGAVIQSTVSAPIPMVENAASLLVDSDDARNIGGLISTDPMSSRTIVESIPRSIGSYRDPDDKTPRPEAFVEPRNIGEYMPVEMAGG
jgi:hypothetical protein